MSFTQFEDTSDTPSSTVAVYKVKIYNCTNDEVILSKRYATPYGAKLMNGRILPETEVHISRADLEPGEDWTPIGYDPNGGKTEPMAYLLKNT